MWSLKIFGLTALVIILAVLYSVIKRHMARRRIRNWSGRGVNKDLEPSSVAVLMGIHPSSVVTLLLTELEVRGGVKVHPQWPLRVEWSQDHPTGGLDSVVAGAIDDEGGLAADGCLIILEALYEKTNLAMKPWSGRKTTIYYREVVENMWRQFVDEGEDDASMIPWLLLERDDDKWVQVGNGEVERLALECHRRLNLAAQHLVPYEVYMKALKGAKQGYFRYRKDLRVTLSRMVHGKDDHLVNAPLRW